MLILSLLETEVLVLSRGFILCGGGGVWTVPFSSFLPVLHVQHLGELWEGVGGVEEGRLRHTGIEPVGVIAART